MKFDTKSIHANGAFDPHTGASGHPIYAASTFHQANWDEAPQFDYGRSGNPTRSALEQLVAELEGAKHGFAFASGMAAITAVLLTLPTGSHIVACEDVYGGTYRALTRVFSRLGIESTFVDATDLNQIEAAIQPNTKLLYLETPSNPNLKITDLKGAIRISQTKGREYGHPILTVVDNTFMSPLLQTPHAFGADVVVHSATKFLGGHSDLVAGVATCLSDEVASEIYLIQNGFGGVLGPNDSWLLMRGIKTLPVRMRQSQATAQLLARYFQQHPKVKNVYYPGLTSHPGHAIHTKQAKGPGAVLSFELESAEAVRNLVERLKLPLFAVSLGAVETILSYPVRMSHASMPEPERLRRGITGGLLRLSTGLEASEDLLNDFEQALKGV